MDDSDSETSISEKAEESTDAPEEDLTERIVLEKPKDFPNLVTHLKNSINNFEESKDHIYFKKEKSYTSLDEYLSSQNGIPLNPCLSAKWLRHICMGLIFLHRNDYIFGGLKLTDVFINERGIVGILISPNILSMTLSKDKYKLSSLDMEDVGKILFRFVTGVDYQIAQGKNYIKGCCPESIEGIKLAKLLMCKRENMRPSLNSVITHPWLEKQILNSDNIFILK